MPPTDPDDRPRRSGDRPRSRRSNDQRRPNDTRTDRSRDGRYRSDRSRDDRFRDDRPRPPRVSTTREGNDGVVFVGQADPLYYFPDIISFFTRDDIERVVLKSRGRAISNAVDVAERVRRRFLRETPVAVVDVQVGTEQVDRRDGKGTYPMSFIKIAMARDERKAAKAAAQQEGDGDAADGDAK